MGLDINNGISVDHLQHFKQTVGIHGAMHMLRNRVYIQFI